MNCKPPCLAMIVQSCAGNEGKIVEVKGSITEGMRGDLAYPCQPFLWHCKGRVTQWGFSEEFVDFAFPDAWLKEIRNDPGQDETLDWLPVPTTHKETA